MLAVRETLVVLLVFIKAVYVMAGATKSSGVPANSSAPISGVDASLVSPSKSKVTEVTGVPPASNWDGITVSILSPAT